MRNLRFPLFKSNMKRKLYFKLLKYASKPFFSYLRNKRKVKESVTALKREDDSVTVLEVARLQRSCLPSSRLFSSFSSFYQFEFPTIGGTLL